MWKIPGGRKSVKFGILAAGVIGVAVASTGAALATQPSVQIEVCGSGAAGEVQLSGKNQDFQSFASDFADFPANGCRTFSNLWWATTNGEVSANGTFKSGAVINVKCGVGGAADGTTVSCAMPELGGPDRFEAQIVPTRENPAVTGNGIAKEFNAADSLARTGLENLCKQAGYKGIQPGIITNAAAAQAGQSKTPEGKILVSASGTCMDLQDLGPGGENQAQAQA